MELAFRKRQADDIVKGETNALKKAKEKLEGCIQAQAALQKMAQEVQQEAHQQVDKIVSRCLSTVFEAPYRFRIEFEQMRGKTSANFVYFKNGRKCDPRVDSGGVLDITALALRLVSMILTVPPVRRMLVLDEPFKGISKYNLGKVAELLKVLSKELETQFLIATHDKELEVGKVIEL